MEKIWLKSYPEGVPAEIDFGNRQSLINEIDVYLKSFKFTIHIQLTIIIIQVLNNLVYQ